MGKLFNLKEWLTVADAARHLSIAFGEDVTEADVLRLALDGRLRLSVYFVNHVKARCGNVVTWDETDWTLIPDMSVWEGDFKINPDIPKPKDFASVSLVPFSDFKVKPYPPKLQAILNKLAPDERDKFIPVLINQNIGGERYLSLSDDVGSLVGVWGLPMIGGERLDIEHQYQNMTDGPAVTFQFLEGTFVEGDGKIYQLQEIIDWVSDERNELKRLKQRIAEENIEDAEAESLLNQHKETWEKLLGMVKAGPEENNYYAADGLPEDAVIVVRTEALRELERHSNDAPLPTSRDHVSDKLAKMNQAAQKFWSNADRDDRGTHPDNATVAKWFVEQGFSTTLADKAATIIRPEWAPSGRKPEE
jgi:hypothetical protein